MLGRMVKIKKKFYIFYSKDTQFSNSGIFLFESLSTLMTFSKGGGEQQLQ